MAIDFLVSGGGGFIGSNMTEFLVRQGATVRVFDNFLTGRRDNLQAVAGKIDLVEGDLREAAQVRRAMAGVRHVIHMGALPSVPRSVAEPQLAHDININGTLNLLLAARDAKCERVVFSSSSAIYGETPTLPKQEEMTPAPVSPYGLHKITGEYYGSVFWQLYGLPTVALRYFNVFGPRQDPKSEYAAVIPKFITTMLAGKPPVIFGDGTQSRDFTHVQNVLEANLAACRAPREAFGQSFNIACAGRITLRELVQTINELLGTKIAPRFDPPRAGDIKHSQADVRKAAARLGWNPRIGFAEGLRQVVEWYRAGANPATATTSVG